MLKLLRRYTLLCSILLIGGAASAQKDMFGLDSVQTKLVNNKGIGPDNLLGVRNMRVVLHNILYRIIFIEEKPSRRRTIHILFHLGE